jgi:hypothetical protein
VLRPKAPDFLRPALILLKRARGQDDHRLPLRPIVFPKAPNEFDAVEWTGDANAGHDNVSRRGQGQRIGGVIDFDRVEPLAAKVFRVHRAVVL